jgi:hypothetical protein
MFIGFSSHFLSAQTNLVQNPSFENGFTSWLKGPSASYSLPSIFNDGFNSSSSVGYNLPSGTTGFYQNVPIQINKAYILSFWYKATGDNSDVRLWSRLKDATGAIIYLWTTSATSDPLRSFNRYLSTSDAWIEHRVEFTNTIAISLELAIRVYAGSETAFDEFSLVEKSELGIEEYIKSKYALVKNTIATKELFFVTDSKDVQIYNSKGQLIRRISVNKGDQINVSNFEKGMYILNGEVNGEKVSQKILIK